MDWKLEVVPVPVSDVDRAKTFYAEQAGFIVDLDTQIGDEMRLVQLTPPGSGCSIQLSSGILKMQPGVLEGLQLVASDIEAARAELVERGVKASPAQHMDGGKWVEGRGGEWNSFVFFSDPDGNGWVLQERPGHNSSGDENPIPEAANPGPVRPPLVYLGSILLGLLLHFAWPLPLVRHPVGVLIGAGVGLLAVGLFITAVRTFRAASTPVPGNRPTTTIVRTGPYRFSRNPIYLAFSVLQVGIALCVDSLWLLITLVPALALMSFWVIPREERYLEARFSSEYLSYKSSVRRWL